MCCCAGGGLCWLERTTVRAFLPNSEFRDLFGKLQLSHGNNTRTTEIGNATDEVFVFLFFWEWFTSTPLPVTRRVVEFLCAFVEAKLRTYQGTSSRIFLVFHLQTIRHSANCLNLFWALVSSPTEKKNERLPLPISRGTLKTKWGKSCVQKHF